ncbi:hypothetical protein FO519_007571 [Halicephalobus sp. NKZ332]|nr:hypothetical protein FO519_007571 [Halicephalobus sp. NKZ332]
MGKKPTGKKPVSAKLNPFDLKYTVKRAMTKKGAKNYEVAGKPTAAKSKAIKKREKTIGIEFNRMGIVNEIKDARAAERSDLSKEAKAAHRFVALKKKNLGKKKFNLGDDYESGDEDFDFLPKGKDLSQVQRFERARDLEDEDEGLDADVIALANFGGGQLNAKLKGEDGRTKKLTRKDIFDEIMSKSKEGKMIRQMAKDDLVVMTETLDEKFKKIRNDGVLDPFKAKFTQEPEKKSDDYDEIYGSLLFDTKKKAIPVVSEKQKAEKEVAKLAELERQRLKRMRGDSDGEDGENHVGADEEVKVAKKKQKKEKTTIIFDRAGKGHDAPQKPDDKLDLKTRKTDDSKAENSNMPFVFEMPTSFEDFRDLYSSYFDDQWMTLTERLIKCNHPSLKPGNKDGLAKVFKLGLRFYDALAQKQAFDQIKPMIAVLRKFLEINPSECAKYVRALLAFKRKSYIPTTEVNSRPTASFDFVAFFALVSELFPTSDAFHCVCTPTFYFLLEVLNLSQIDSLKSIGVTILLTKILVKWIQDSKRYVPELIRITRMILELAVEKRDEDLFRDPFAYPNVSRKNNNIDVLVQKEKVKNMPEGVLKLSEIFGESGEMNENQLRCHFLKSLLQVVDSTTNIYESLNFSYEAIFGPQLEFLKRIDGSKLPKELQDILENLVEKISGKIEEFKPRTHRQRKVIKKVHMIKMLDPVIEEDFDPSKPKRGMHKRDPNAEEKRMKKLIKNEQRGAIKELRMDARFIARVQQQKKQNLKEERDLKTRKIIASLRGQESEYKKNHFKPKKF